MEIFNLIAKNPKRFLAGALLIPVLVIAIPSFFTYKNKIEGRASKETIPADNYYREGEYTKAIETYQRVIDKYPRTNSTARALFYKGNCHYNLKEYDKAIFSYQKCRRKSPKGSLAINALVGVGYSYQEQGNFKEALETYRKIIEKYPQNYLASHTSLNIGMCLEALNDWEKAKESYQKILDFHPDSPWKDSARARIEWLSAHSKIE